MRAPSTDRDSLSKGGRTDCTETLEQMSYRITDKKGEITFILHLRKFRQKAHLVCESQGRVDK